MTMFRRRFPCAAVLLALAPPLAAQTTPGANPAPAPAPAPITAAPVDAALEGHPALWRVADADTTIFLFGTVHALPERARWFHGHVAGALLSSDTLVAELMPGTLADKAFIGRYTQRAKLPAGETLRALLTPDQRERYEKALTANGMKVDSLDPFKPWFAANTLVIVPLLKQGYSPAAGSESVIEAAAGTRLRREALETGDEQLELFDAMPREVQIANLMRLVDQTGAIGTRTNRIVDAWLAGDVATIASESTSKDDDPRMIEALLYPRNRAWADWIAARLAKPGRVFVAVGAGHLAGERSVQADLVARGLTVTRLQ